MAGKGSDDNLLKAMTDAMLNNEYVKNMCAEALKQAKSQEVTKTIIANDYYDEE